jgi:putative ABC transport system substrate-binding protein
MSIRLRRRDFIAGLGSAAAWPLAARAQQRAIPVVGFLSGNSPGPLRRQVAALHSGLKEVGFVEGQNVALEYRWAEGQYDKLPGLAAELVRRQVAVIIAVTNAGALAAKQATTTIPIVFNVGQDPVKIGLVKSLNRPGGNMTGVTQFAVGLTAKRLGLLREMVPRATTIAVLVNPKSVNARPQLDEAQEASARLGVRLTVLTATAESEFESAFATLARPEAGALLVSAEPLFFARRQLLVLLAARHGVPTIYEWREFATAGGLMSYGTIINDAYRQVGVYTGQVLKGEKPNDLPTVQSSGFEFVINLNTAKALGLAVPPTLLAIADEVLE